MKIAGRVIAYIVLCLAAAAALLLLFPGAKEGFSIEDWQLLAASSGGLLVLAVLWWFIAGRVFWIAMLGWAVVAIPMVSNALVGWALFDAYLEGNRIAGGSDIIAYSEKPIEWPGFDGPVGWEIAFTLRHPKGAKGLINPPEIRMGPSIEIAHDRLYSTMTFGAGYFNDRSPARTQGPLTLLKAAAFQKLYPERFPGSRFGSGSETAVRFYLFPGTVAYLESKDRLCLGSRTAGIPQCATGVKPTTGCIRKKRRRVTQPIYHSGMDLSAIWIATGGNDMVADLSPTLTNVLRQQSRLQGMPDVWDAMQKRLEPNGLARAGYRLCPPGVKSHNYSHTCYCRMRP